MTDPLTPLIAGGVGALLSQLAHASGLDVWQASVGNCLGEYQAINGMKTARRLYDEAERLGLTFSPDRVPDRFAFAWFDEAPKHDDEGIQTLFARLMARAGSDEVGTTPDVRLIGLVGRLSPTDAHIFIGLYSDTLEALPEGTRRQSFAKGSNWTFRELQEMLDLAFPVEGLTTLEFLASLGLVAFEEEKTAWPGSAISLLRGFQPRDVEEVVRDMTASITVVNATRIGVRLFEAVKP